MSAKAQIFTQILYRVIFLFGLACLIVGYGYITGSEPGGLPLAAMIVAWYLLFQAMINFIFCRRFKITLELSRPCHLFWADPSVKLLIGQITEFKC